MKKRIMVLAVALLAAAVCGCDDGDTAGLWIYNDIDAGVTGLYLTGTSNTGNLLDKAEAVSFVDGGWVEDGPLSDGGLGQDHIMAVTGLPPGTYTWRVVFPPDESPLKDTPIPEYKSSREFTLYPGRNNLVLRMSAGD
jgi:hypothetical protein